MASELAENISSVSGGNNIQQIDYFGGIESYDSIIKYIGGDEFFSSVIGGSEESDEEEIGSDLDPESDNDSDEELGSDLDPVSNNDSERSNKRKDNIENMENMDDSDSPLFEDTIGSSELDSPFFENIEDTVDMEDVDEEQSTTEVENGFDEEPESEIYVEEQFGSNENIKEEQEESPLFVHVDGQSPMDVDGQSKGSDNTFPLVDGGEDTDTDIGAVDEALTEYLSGIY